jgi:DNA-binding transcriptional LysR family regulator
MLPRRQDAVDSRSRHKAVHSCTAAVSPFVANMHDLNWNDLRFFLLAVQARTLAGAARAAGVQHTTIGRRLSALERALGAPLFLRRPEGLSLTPLGERLLPLAQKAGADMEAVRDLARSLRNRVRLALPSGFIALFADDLAELTRAHPELSLETLSSAQPANLQRGEADLALRIGPIDDPDLIARPLGEVGSSLYASSRYLQEHPSPVGVLGEDLAGHHIIAFGASLSSLPAAVWLEAHGTHAVVVLRTNEVVTMLEAAASGAGVAVLPCMLGDADSRLVRLTDRVVARRELSLVYRREQRGNRPVRTVADFLVSTLQARAARLSGSAEASRGTRQREEIV